MKLCLDPFIVYRDEIYYLQNLLSRTQAGPGRTVKKEQEEISPNQVQRVNLISVKLSLGYFRLSDHGDRDQVVLWVT